MAVPPHLAKKRAPLGNLTNLKNGSHSAAKSSVPPAIMVLTCTRVLMIFVLWFHFIAWVWFISCGVEILEVCVFFQYGFFF